MKSTELRDRFIAFFEKKGHAHVPSSSVVPKHDPTLLFVNAGMNQFKEVFLGHEVRDYKRATSYQKCIRAGGKHNDLDEVGRDDTHLTFFEMLGNWSFGDYGKREAIVWAWEFVVDVLGLPPESLVVSIYKDDDESMAIWREVVGLEAWRIARFGDIETGDEENFWSMGPTGPCGPCTEIYIDKRPDLMPEWGVGFNEMRYVELWNIVFMSHDRDESGNLTPLGMTSVDTGMGLERMAAVLQGKDGIYRTDVFAPILQKIAEMRGVDMSVDDMLSGELATPHRVLADHVRTLTFAVSEGLPFSNEGRGYVIRRILRRAVRYGSLLGFDAPFLCDLSQAVVDAFGDIYPEIRHVAAQTQHVLRVEEQRFFNTLSRGMLKFENAAEGQSKEIAGEAAFQLYDTFGFPLDLTQILAAERGLSVDLDGFHRCLEEQRQRSASATKFVQNESSPWQVLAPIVETRFVGYEQANCDCRVLRYRQIDDIVEVMLDVTPFYAEGGGQVGDVGTLTNDTLKLRVVDTHKAPAGWTHYCRIEEGFVDDTTMSATMVAAVDPTHRSRVSANHTATHLLQASLRRTLTGQVHQAGSLVRPDHLRFDFTFDRALTDEELLTIERDVNRVIAAGIATINEADVEIEEAKARGAIAIFGEKYGSHVRILDIPGESIELCGGIHVKNTRDIMCFKITQETAIAAGTRRIEALTMLDAIESFQADRQHLVEASEAIKVDHPSLIVGRAHKLYEQISTLSKQITQLNQKLAHSSLDTILNTYHRHDNGLKTYASMVEVADRKELLVYADELRAKMDEGAALLAAIIEDKIAAILIATDGATQKGMHAGKMLKKCLTIAGGKGGGKANMAQGAAPDVHKMQALLNAVHEK